MFSWKFLTVLVIFNLLQASKVNSYKETHPGWIKHGKYEYKIYADKVTAAEAATNCYKMNSMLAILDSIEGAGDLARNLLIGRPMIDSAWIGFINYEKLQVVCSVSEDNHLIKCRIINRRASSAPSARNNLEKDDNACWSLDRQRSAGFADPEITANLCNKGRGYICSRKIGTSRRIFGKNGKEDKKTGKSHQPKKSSKKGDKNLSKKIKKSPKKEEGQIIEEE